jgi:2-polyprenyl-3-methyl-5-hydroxy-6-metoxy-1,4-benzoquinol methylase
MALNARPRRQRAYGENHQLTWIDRFGVWLSSRQIRRSVPDFAGKRVADVGCGYRATIARQLLDRVARLVLVDVSVDSELAVHPKVTAIEGWLPDALAGVAEASQDVVICTSVIEHLSEPLATLHEMGRVLAPGGMLLLNVPSWRGKTFLEFTAFRLGSSPEEIDDHKMYYDPRDLWPLLVRAGFRPRDIRCFKHKFGLNTFARCRKALAPAHEPVERDG